MDCGRAGWLGLRERRDTDEACLEMALDATADDRERMIARKAKGMASLTGHYNNMNGGC